MTEKTEDTKETMKWQFRNRPEWPGQEPPWSDCLMGKDGKPDTVWLQCEYRRVTVSTKSDRY